MKLAVQKLHQYFDDKPSFTQTAFAEAIGVTPGYVSMLLDGTREKPGQQTIFNIRQLVALTGYDIDLIDWNQEADDEL